MHSFVKKYVPSLGLCLLAELCCLGARTEAGLVTDPTGSWRRVPFSGPNQHDYTDDQQTGTAKSSADIVGNESNPALYTQFNSGASGDLTDGELLFRARLGAPGGSSTAAFDRILFVGIDANSDGALDLYLGVHNQGSNHGISIYGPGTDLNTSPSTTSITGPLPSYTYSETGLNYAYTTVETSTTDIDGDGETDYFLSFAVPFNDIVTTALNESGIAVTENTPLSYVLATATQDNSLNQDLNGVPKNFDATLSWAALGAASASISASGLSASTPEPTSTSLMGVAAILAMAWRRRRSATCS